MCSDIITNLISDVIFVSLVTFLLLGLGSLSRYARIGRAQQFFGFKQHTKVKIYVSSFEHEGMKTKRVVNAMEYEMAVEMREALQQLSGKGIIHRIADYLAGIIGQTIRYPEPDIEVSPLGEINKPPYLGSMILIGGPVTNQLVKFYLQDSSRFRFNESTGQYQRLKGEKYQDIKPSNNVAFIEKKIIEEQIVILVHGFDEEQTRRAVQYLINSWEELYKQYGRQDFGIRI